LLTLPLVEFVVMPSAVFGVLAAAFGLDGPIWWFMGQGIGFMMSVAHWVAALPGSTQMTSAFSVGALLTMTLGLLWLVLWQTPMRFAGLAVSVLGLAFAFTGARPDIIIDKQGQALAYRSAAGNLDVLNAKSNFFGVSQWLTADADARQPRDPALMGTGACDATGCIGRLRDGRTLALILDPRIAAEDCGRADIVVTRFWLGDTCKGPSLVIDGAHLAAHGATEIRLAKNALPIMRTARTPTLDRPWSRPPRIITPTPQPVGEQNAEPSAAELMGD
jgi:competence protein ComEC